MNLAVRRTPKPHVTVKYLEPDFAALFLDGLRGLGPGDSYRGRELVRNAAVGELALATGLRLQEFSYLLSYEVPAAAAEADGRADRVPGAGRGDQGPEVPHDLDQLRRPGRSPPVPGTGPGRVGGRITVIVTIPNTVRACRYLLTIAQTPGHFTENANPARALAEAQQELATLVAEGRGSSPAATILRAPIQRLEVAILIGCP